MDDLDKDYDEIVGDDHGEANEQVELEDEQQDWRLLRTVGSKKNKLPKRGDKEFEPAGSARELSALEESRNAMYSSLDGERKHTNKVHVSGVWHPDICKAKLNISRGPHFKSIGKADSNGVIWLLPEEVIYLVERGSMSLYSLDGSSVLSLQACYSACMAGVTNERYLVYAYLKRLGFIVQRADSFANLDFKSLVTEPVKLGTFRRLWDYLASLVGQAMRQANDIMTRKLPAFGPVVCGGVWHSYDAIYRALQIVPFYSHKTEHIVNIPNKPPFRVAYNVWKPRPSFKKSNLSNPDFRIVVVNARKDKMPTLAQIDSLFQELPVSNDITATQQQRLKQGHKNVILGVVDYGITSFITYGDVAFGDERLYENQQAGLSKSAHKAKLRGKR
ncbi:tRNA-splicing endonuclease subunit sen54 N-term-domain-containing protein [Lipomyces arxii]|uniref:tRNA-splicing endonuclease subunit sen54 N-term-domain-containing protein n=1 Tax=Lipomyces arxii TaxID=56418 RepID=UPI0034CF73C5